MVRAATEICNKLWLRHLLRNVREPGAILAPQVGSNLAAEALL